MEKFNKARGYKFRYEKLVRDNIPEIIKGEGWLVKEKSLSTVRYRLELKRKMQEEAAELASARTQEEIATELSDILELAQCLADCYGLSQSAVKSVKKAKQKKNGSFKQQRYIEHISYHPGADSRWLKYHLKKSDKYPLIP